MTDTPQLRDRIAEAIAAQRNGPASDGRGWYRTAEDREQSYAAADAVLAVVQPELDQHRVTIRRLNYRAQQAESRVAAIARAVRDWQFTERGTYMPLRSLSAIARIVGRPVPDGRFELHYQRVERLERELAVARAAGMRESAAMLRRYCPTHGAEDTCLMDCHCEGADEIDRDAKQIAPPAPTT